MDGARGARLDDDFRCGSEAGEPSVLNSSSEGCRDYTCLLCNIPSTRKVWEWCLDWRKLFWTPRPARDLLRINVVVFFGVFLSQVLIFESSSKALRQMRHMSAIFPLYIPNAAAFAFACKWKGSSALPNFVALSSGGLYTTLRDSETLGVTVVYLFILAFVAMLEAQVGADFLRRKLCRPGKKDVPTIDRVQEALHYFLIIFGVSLCSQILTVFVECVTGFIAWTSFPQMWSTRWLGVLAAYHTIAPAVIHLLAYPPRNVPSFRPRKLIESILLLCGIAVVLSLIIFSLPFTTFIRPLPYLLYPLIIFSVFRFNQLGWTIVVAVISYFCSWGSMHYKSSALYYTSGSSERSSPKLLIQIELFLSVLGMVAITLAAAVREKKELAKDLLNLNQRLEEAVSKRTEELIKANNELQISQAHAEKANLAKSDFLANMSHEIRTPIHGILGLTALLLQSDLSQDQLESLLSVKDCADLLLHIINSILDLAKIEAGRLEVESVPFSIRKVVSNTLRMLQVRAKDRGLDLLWNVKADVPAMITGDPGKLQQCLLNLVGNALKFTHSGSVKVHISLHSGFEKSFSNVVSVRKGFTHRTPEKPSYIPSRLRSWASWPSSDVKVELDEGNMTSSVIDMFDRQLTESYLSSKGSSNGADIVAQALERQKAQGQEANHREYLLIEVRDTGIGISKENVVEMFNPFTQADASTSRLYGGTGLGLSIVQRFVELQGGKIWVESEVGIGSVFSFVVPFARVGTTKENVNDGRKNGSLQSSAALFQPLLASSDKPPRAQRKSSLQQTTLGKGRRAHSLNTLLKNLKFSPRQFNDAEPLLQTSSSIDSCGEPESKPSASDCTHVDTTTGDSIVKGKSFESTQSLGRPRNSHEAEKQSGPSTTRATSAAPKVLDTGKEFVSRSNKFANPKEGQMGTTLDGVSVEVGKDQPVQILRSRDTSLVGTSVAGSSVESLSTGNGVAARAKNTYPDLELGLFVTSQKHENSEKHTEGKKDFSSDNLLLQRSTGSGTLGATQGTQDETLKPKKPKLRVLLAEDNIINQKVATKQLQKHGYTVSIVGDGLQALNAIKTNHDSFDLVLMDIQMPMMDGLEATDRIREEEAKQGWKRIPILGLTAHAISGYQDTCLSHGMDAYLGKPFEINQLLKIIEKVV